MDKEIIRISIWNVIGDALDANRINLFRGYQLAQLMTGKQALLEMLKAEGVEFIFGNPGTSEGPIIDMLGDYP